MSLPRASIFPVPERTAEIAHAAFPTGNRYRQMRDTLGTVDTHVHFAALYPAVGQPAEAPRRFAVVTIMPLAENLKEDVTGTSERKPSDRTACPSSR